MIDFLMVTMAFGFLGLAVLIALLLILAPLRDKPYVPGRVAVRPHQPSRVVRAAPEREDVTA